MKLEFEIISVYPINREREGNEARFQKGARGNCEFVLRPSALAPIKLEDSYKNKKEEWVNSEVAEIHGAEKIVVKRASVAISKNNDPYVRVSGLSLSWDDQVTIGKAALKLIEARIGGEAS